MRSPQLHSNDRDTACRSGKCTARTNFITRPQFRHFRVEASSASPIFSAMYSSMEDPLSVTVFPLPSGIEAQIRARLRRLRGCGPLSTNAGSSTNSCSELRPHSELADPTRTSGLRRVVQYPGQSSPAIHAGLRPGYSMRRRSAPTNATPSPLAPLDEWARTAPRRAP